MEKPGFFIHAFFRFFIQSFDQIRVSFDLKGIVTMRTDRFYQPKLHIRLGRRPAGAILFLPDSNDLLAYRKPVHDSR